KGQPRCRASFLALPADGVGMSDLVRVPASARVADAFERGQLRTGEAARLAGTQMADVHRPDGDAFQTKDFVFQPGEHPANLPVLAFAQDDAQPGALPLRLEALDLPGTDMALRQPNALEQAIDVLPAGNAGYLDEVRLFDLEARMHQSVGQVAVV